MALIEEFFIELDRRWAAERSSRLRLRVIGSAALMLQSDYRRGTKDGDVLESDDIGPEVRDRLLALTGRGTSFHRDFGVYLEFVTAALPFLPQRPVFHPIRSLRGLQSLSVDALDIVDVVVSKLKRFSASDAADIREMAARGLLDHRRLVARFVEAVDRFSTDARVEDLPRCVRNLHAVERDYLRVPETRIDLPDWA